MDSTGRYGFQENTFLQTTERPIDIRLKIPFIMGKTAKTLQYLQSQNIRQV